MFLMWIGSARVGPQMSRIQGNLMGGLEKVLLRAMYPEAQEISYVPFRSRLRGVGGGVNIYSRTRLDFYLISPSLLDGVHGVKYEDRLGTDFDHKGVSLTMGKRDFGGKINIFESTLSDMLAVPSGIMSIYDTINNHLVEQNEAIRANIVQLDILIREIEMIKLVQGRVGSNDDLERRRRIAEDNIAIVLNRFPAMEVLLEEAFSCSYKQLYEMIMIGIKNSLVAIQTRRTKEQSATRDYLINRIKYMEQQFGETSEQAEDIREKLLRHDDMLLKEKATKFREFLDANNERATKAFCKLSKEGGLNDDISQIKKDSGEGFKNGTERGEYVKNFYERLYCKRLDNLISVENFLGNETANTRWVENRKLNEVEKESLEGVVSMAELQKAFDESNFNSSSGWDGMSYRVIGKFWEALRFPMIKMVNETFRDGELMETFKMGIIKVIPKKGNAERLGDWRPITLLCCGYKIISGIVANRLELYLMKIMGRAQKGFLKHKQIHTCAANLITCISQSWNVEEECGIMCVDFKKAFDSIEHDAIKTILRFFNFGEFMVKMVSTLLNKRTARIILDEGYSETFNIERGTPQGDRSSPYIFIICMEVLLMKILSMEGGGIDSCDFIKRKLNGLNIESMTAEAYADDLTIIFKMSER
jgi:hypothetical protein